MHLITLRFADEALEKAYSEQKARSLRAMYRVFTALAAVFGFLLGFVDRAVLGSDRNIAMVHTLRLVVVLPMAVIVVVVGYLPDRWFRRLWQPAIMLAVIGGLSTSMVGASFAPDPEQLEVGLAVGTLVLLNVAAGTAFSLRFVYAAIALVPANIAIAIMGAPLPKYTMPATMLLWCSAAFSLVAAYQLERRDRLAFLERDRSERLLRNILPAPVGERLKGGEAPIADDLAEVTVLFADIVGFTEVSRELDSRTLVATLDELFSTFDDIADRHGLEKIKTIGDAYMVVAGVPTPRADHAHAICAMALEMRDAIARRAPLAGKTLQLRIGIHSGPVTAGVIGKKKFIYDVWGDTVNTASRMESHGLPGEIQLSDATHALLADAFTADPRGPVTVKGLGNLSTWWLRRRAE